MSENLTKLREAMHWERGAREQHVIPGAPTYPRPCPACAKGTSFTDAALAAVEQELAALEAERDELRKRPTLEAIEAAIQEEYNRDWNGPIVRPYTNVVKAIRELYFRRGLSPFSNLSAPAEKAAQ